MTTRAQHDKMSFNEKTDMVGRVAKLIDGLRPTMDQINAMKAHGLLGEVEHSLVLACISTSILYKCPLTGKHFALNPAFQATRH